jgi:hypothetical protein
MNETLKYSVHALHDIAGATWFGGNLFGVAALNSGVRAAHNPHERGAVLNQTWENFAPLSVASALAFGGTWAAIRLSDPRLSEEPLSTVARVRDWLTVGAVVGTVASGALNRVIASERRVPVESGTAPIKDAENEAENTPRHIARAQRAMRFVAAADLLVGAGLLATGAVLEQQLIDYSPAKGLLTGPRKVALDAVKAVAAAELVRRAGKLLGDSVEALRPHEPSTAERIKSGAVDLFQRAAESVGVRQPPKTDPLARLVATVASAFDGASSVFASKADEVVEEAPAAWRRIAGVFNR